MHEATNKPFKILLFNPVRGSENAPCRIKPFYTPLGFFMSAGQDAHDRLQFNVQVFWMQTGQADILTCYSWFHWSQTLGLIFSVVG